MTSVSFTVLYGLRLFGDDVHQTDDFQCRSFLSRVGRIAERLGVISVALK